MFYSPKNIIKQVETSTAIMRLLDIGVVHYSYLNNVDVDVEQHIENHKALINLVGAEKHPILVDASELINITAKAREKVKELETIGPTLARAFVARSIGHKLLINFFLRVNKSSLNNKVFSNHEDAVKWLLTVREQQVLFALDHSS